MMKNTNLFLALIFTLLLLTKHSYGQNVHKVWYFGDHAGLDFNGSNPIPLIDGMTTMTEGCSTISDNSGSLLFYTDGINVWNRNHSIMINGTGLYGGNGSSTQSTIIIPKPTSDSIYYIFTTTKMSPAGGCACLAYSIVDISLQGGLGEVTSKNNSLLYPSTEKLTAVNHTNGTDVWIVTHEWNSDAFKAYLLTSSGVSSQPVTSNVGLVHTGAYPYNEGTGAIKFSPDGDRIACCIPYMDKLQIFNFDASTGMFSFPMTIPFIRTYYPEFSPSGRFLYAGSADGSDRKLKQFDLSSETESTIINSAYILKQGGTAFGALQLAPDGKIYVSRISFTNISRISDPELPGVQCNYEDTALFLAGNSCTLSLPSFNASYFYNPDKSTSNKPNKNIRFQPFEVGPNPFQNFIKIRSLYNEEQVTRFKLYDCNSLLLIDECIEKQKIVETPTLKPGLYLYHIITSKGIVYSGKLLSN